jgi:hypothetical protein
MKHYAILLLIPLLLIPPLLLIAWYLRCLVIICNRG